MFLPLTLLVGILTTFRVAGPVFVFHRFLKNIREGNDPGVIRLRKGDKLHDLADAMNAAYAAIKEREDDVVANTGTTEQADAA